MPDPRFAGGTPNFPDHPSDVFLLIPGGSLVPLSPGSQPTETQSAGTGRLSDYIISDLKGLAGAQTDYEYEHQDTTPSAAHSTSATAVTSADIMPLPSDNDQRLLALEEYSHVPPNREATVETASARISEYLQLSGVKETVLSDAVQTGPYIYCPLSPTSAYEPGSSLMYVALSASGYEAAPTGEHSTAYGAHGWDQDPYRRMAPPPDWAIGPQSQTQDEEVRCAVAASQVLTSRMNPATAGVLSMLTREKLANSWFDRPTAQAMTDTIIPPRSQLGFEARGLHI
ncbi:hypothetical protein I317_02481 [Kwoniella heveanensis CBS 569]|nr:hypothetical protein I317_02481 [Kwoniella heveanensis CBS 569]